MLQVWSEDDLDIILSNRYGAFIVERYGEDLAAALTKLDVRPIDILSYVQLDNLLPLEMEGQHLCHSPENSKVRDHPLQSGLLSSKTDADDLI